MLSAGACRRGVTTDWNDRSRAYFAELEETARAIAAELGGEFRDSRLRRLTKLVTRSTRSAAAGWAEHRRSAWSIPTGEVFGCKNFFAADGSVMPGLSARTPR